MSFIQIVFDLIDIFIWYELPIFKLWKVRLLGYEEAIKLFKKLDENAPEWNTFSEIIKLFVIDSNTVAQEKGLEAILMFFKFSAITGWLVEYKIVYFEHDCVN